MNDEKLIPCAFCYSEPSISEHDGYTEIYCCNEYMIDEDGASVQHEIRMMSKSRDAVISEWNAVMR